MNKILFLFVLFQLVITTSFLSCNEEIHDHADFYQIDHRSWSFDTCSHIGSNGIDDKSWAHGPLNAEDEDDGGIARVEDIDPLYIGHVAVTASHPNTPIEIKASIVGEIEKALVYYRNKGEVVFNQVAMALEDEISCIYTGVIPADDVVLDKAIEYFIEAKDISGNIRYDPPSKKPYNINVSKAIWKPIGPWTGYLLTVEVDPQNPNVIYAGGDYNIWKSIDGGENWQIINGRGTIRSPAHTIAIDPKNPSTIFCGGYVPWGFGKGHIYRSNDGGNSWEKIERLKDCAPCEITIDPVEPSIIYIATYNKGILKSIDGGENWEQINNGITTDFCTSIKIDTSSNIYVGTDQGVFKSINSGESFFSINNGLESLSVIPHGITVDPHTPDIVYALIDGGQGGVFQSEDGGNNWKRITPKIGDLFYSTYLNPGELEIDPQGSGIIYLCSDIWGVWKNEKKGHPDAWENTRIDVSAEKLVPPWHGKAIKSLAVSPRSPNRVYAAGWTGFFISTDKAEGWRQSNNGIHQVWTETLEVSPRDQTIYAGTLELRGFKTENGGKSWEQMCEGLVIPDDIDYNNYLDIYSIAVDPSDPNIVYAGIGPTGNIVEGTLKKSLDGGKKWFSAADGLPNGKIYGLAIDPLTPSIIYAAPLGQLDERGIYKSIDGGKTWKPVNNGSLTNSTSIRCISIDPSNPKIVYAGSYKGESAGIFKSEDGGRTWNLLPPLPNFNPEKDVIGEILIDPKDTNILYARTQRNVWWPGRIWKSTNGGKDWKVLAEVRWSSITALALDPRLPHVIYGETHYNKVFRSVDGGENWEEFNVGIGHPLSTGMRLRVDPNLPNTIYSAKSGGGVYRCEVVPGPLSSYKLYAPKTATVGEAFELEVIALDEDSWIVTDYYGPARLSADEGSISPGKVRDFVNGIATINVTLDTPGNITITVRDSKDPTKYGTCTILVERKKISIVKPKKACLYILDREITPTLGNTIIIGGITIEAQALEEVDKVEFYVNNELKNADYEKPYTWLWDEFAIGRYILKVVAHNENGDTVSDEVDVIIFNW